MPQVIKQKCHQEFGRDGIFVLRYSKRTTDLMAPVCG